ncbi:MAG: hypothetical protein ACK53Y_15765, partial [bacterium]
RRSAAGRQGRRADARCHRRGSPGRGGAFGPAKPAPRRRADRAVLGDRPRLRRHRSGRAATPLAPHRPAARGREDVWRRRGGGGSHDGRARVEQLGPGQSELGGGAPGTREPPRPAAPAGGVGHGRRSRRRAARGRHRRARRAVPRATG